jgi:hypothetical protein
VRKLQSYVAKYGPEVGPRLYHLLQSQAAHAGVSARLRRKIETLTDRRPRSSTSRRGGAESLPLFPTPSEN